MAHGKKNEDGGTGNILVLLALVALMMCGGAWNYQRNLALEEQNQGARAFKGYSDEALDQMAEAYAGEAESLRRRYDSATARRTGVRHRAGLLMEKVKEFDRVRADGDRLREIASRVAESEARLRDIRTEQSYRGNTKQIDVHLRRLTRL